MEGKLFEDYIHDMKIIRRFAMLNRKAMVESILTGMHLDPVDTFTTIRLNLFIILGCRLIF